jgi:mannose/fructose/N-acetylgalactosamine-specific phosphotransferase system component IIC
MSTGSLASSLAQRNGSGTLVATSYVSTLTSTVTAAGTTVLVVGSTQVQVFTGSTTQTVTLPTTSIAAAQKYDFINNSSGAVTVNASGGALVKTIAAGASSVITALVVTPTAAADWYATA